MKNEERRMKNGVYAYAVHQVLNTQFPILNP